MGAAAAQSALRACVAGRSRRALAEGGWAPLSEVQSEPSVQEPPAGCEAPGPVLGCGRPCHQRGGQPHTL